MWFLRYASGETDRHATIAILRTPTGNEIGLGEVTLALYLQTPLNYCTVGLTEARRQGGAFGAYAPPQISKM